MLGDQHVAYYADRVIGRRRDSLGRADAGSTAAVLCRGDNSVIPHSKRQRPQSGKLVRSPALPRRRAWRFSNSYRTRQPLLSTRPASRIGALMPSGKVARAMRRPIHFAQDQSRLRSEKPIDRQYRRATIAPWLPNTTVIVTGAMMVDGLKQSPSVDNPNDGRGSSIRTPSRAYDNCLSACRRLSRAVHFRTFGRRLSRGASERRLRKLANRFTIGLSPKAAAPRLAKDCRFCQILPTGQESPTDGHCR